jgi:uncharacterized membrane protein YeaQ/YmgE (transglycosylase-associated protein family)
VSGADPNDTESLKSKTDSAEAPRATEVQPAPDAASAAPPRMWRNLALFLCSDSLAALGWAVASSQTVLAVMLKEAGFPKVILGLPMALGILGFAMAQVPAAFLASRATHKTRWLYLMRAAAAVPVLIAVGGVMLATPQRPWTTAFLLFLPLLLGSLISGAARPVRAQLDAHLIPQAARGRYYGAVMIGQGALGMVGAALARSLLRNLRSRAGFGACVTVAGVVGATAAIPLRYLTELHAPGNDIPVRLAAYVGALRTAVARDRNFRNFLWGRFLIALAYMSAAF